MEGYPGPKGDRLSLPASIRIYVMSDGEEHEVLIRHERTVAGPVGLKIIGVFAPNGDNRLPELFGTEESVAIRAAAAKHIREAFGL